MNQRRPMRHRLPACAIPLAFALSLALAGCDREPAPCAPSSPADAAACVDADAYAADLQLLAVERSPGSAGWQTAGDHCRSVLTELGFEVEAHDYGSGINIVGTKRGTGSDRHVVLVSAHYDSVVGCAGADDNASGVAGALGVARALAAGTWNHDLVIACWDGEEQGLVGSDAWAARAADGGDPIEVVIALEMIGYTDDTPDSQSLPVGFDLVFPDAAADVEARQWRGDFIALVADEAADPMVRALVDHAPEGLPVLRVDLPASLLDSPATSDLRRSDHASFWARGIPAIMVTDTANFRYGGYHCGDGADTVSRLNVPFAVDVTRAIASATAERLADPD